MVSHLPKEIDEVSNLSHYYETHWKRVALDLLEQSCAPLAGKTLLDYGCGRGETLMLASERGLTPTGADLDPECVALSQKHGQAVEIQTPHDPAAQFGDDSFDFVACLHVLEHVDRPKEVLQSLGRVTRQALVVAIPNLRRLPRPRFLNQEPPAINEGHLQGWDHSHFRNLAERHCDLKLVAWGHDHVRLPVLSAAAKAIGGDKLMSRLETGIFLNRFKFHSSSIIALLVPK